MKKILSFCVLLFMVSAANCQEEYDPEISIQAGVLMHFNQLNYSKYFNQKIPSGLNPDMRIPGFSLEIKMSTKYDYLDIVLGTILEKDWNAYLATTDYKFYGGGVYLGICPSIKYKHFGITSLFGLGAFSYKEHVSYYDDNPTIVDIYESKSSGGLGAITSLGVYLKLGHLGINPQVQAVFSGGSDSFLLYGFVVPLSLKF